MLRFIFICSLFIISLFSNEVNIDKFFNENKDVMFLIDPKNGEIKKANKRAAEFYGFSMEKLQEMNIKDINTFTKEQVRLEMERAKEERRNHFIFKHRMADNSIKKVEVHSYPIIYNKQKVLFSIIHEYDIDSVIDQFNERLNEQVDIQTNELKEGKNTLIVILVVSSLTFILGIIFLIYLLNQKKKLTNHLIKKNNEVSGLKERLELAVEGSNDGIWDWDIITNEVYFSPRWKGMVGYDENEIKNDYLEWETRVHKSDLQKALNAIEDHLNKKINHYQATFRMKHKNGSWIWITARGKAHFNEKGEPTRMIGFHTDVTDLLNLQFYYKNLFNVVKEGIVIYSVIDGGERFLFKEINPAVEQIENIKREDIIGKDLLAVFPGALEMGFVDILRSVYLSGKGRVLPAVKYKDNRIEGYRRNHIYKLPNGDIVAIYEDLTEEYDRIEMLNDILKEKEFQNKYLSALFDIQPNIVLTKHQGVLERVNRAFLELFDCENVKEFKKEYECICDTFIKKEGYLSSYMDGLYWVDHILKYPNDIHKAIILKDNKEHEFIVDAKRLNFDKEDRTIVVLIDITKVKEQEELMLKQEKRAVMGDMLENIAHQWRQPLSLITTMASAIQLENENDMLDLKNLDEYCDNIIVQADHLSTTVDDFRDFYKTKKEKERFSFEKILERTIKLISTKISNRSINIIKQIDERDIIGLPNELIQVLMNIISNAIDELESKDHKRSIFIKTFEEQGCFIIKIKNNGGHIPEHILPDIFNAHFTTKEEFDGTGIGLHMSRLIIENSFGGEISVENIGIEDENEVYEGVEFTIVLPLE